MIRLHSVGRVFPLLALACRVLTLDRQSHELGRASHFKLVTATVLPTTQDIFSTLGTVSEVRIVKDRATGNSAGSAFVKFEDHQAAAIALKTINGRILYNKVRGLCICCCCAMRTIPSATWIHESFLAVTIRKSMMPLLFTHDIAISYQLFMRG